MAVYTEINKADLSEFLATHDVGSLVSHTGISDGIENTNYFVSTNTGEFVLTLFETVNTGDLPWFLDLMAFFAEQGIPCAHPLADTNGRYLSTLCGKPAALVVRLEGSSIQSPRAEHCADIGEILGRMHLAGSSFHQTRDNDRGPEWWQTTTARVMGHISASDGKLLRSEIEFQLSHRSTAIPTGVIHADLFRDNALFTGDRLTGIIDFYYACNDVLLYDLAVTANDWCTQANGSLNEERLHNLLTGYDSRRTLLEEEEPIWPVMLRAAALRFWLSRLQDKHFPRDGEITQTKDPDEFRRILEHHIATPASLAIP